MYSSLQTEENQNSQIGSYQLGKTIGAGTFGKVKVARHLPTG
jgi:serine/threonine protein kinase